MKSAAKDTRAQKDPPGVSEKPAHSKDSESKPVAIGGFDQDHGVEAEQAKRIAEEHGD